MLQKCYGCIGRWDTSAGEVPRQVRYLSRRGTSAAEIPQQARVPARVGGRTSWAYIGAGELEAGSYELEAASWELDRRAGS